MTEFVDRALLVRGQKGYDDQRDAQHNNPPLVYVLGDHNLYWTYGHMPIGSNMGPTHARKLHNLTTQQIHDVTPIQLLQSAKNSI